MNVKDFPGAENGLQVENRDSSVTRIGATVDASTESFSKAIEAGVDFLIVHHGLFWEKSAPWTDQIFKRFSLCLEGGLAVYGSHLPLDCHPEIGNNVLLAKALGLTATSSFLPYEGNDIGLIASGNGQTVAALGDEVSRLTKRKATLITGGPKTAERVGILTGSGTSALPFLKEEGIETFITGELKQHAYSLAVDNGINLILGGHYATETFGVDALAREAAEHFGLPYTFISTECPL